MSEHRVQTLERKRGLFRGGSTRRTGRPGHGQPAARQRTLPVHYEQTIFTLGGLLQAEAALGLLRRPGSQTPPAVPWVRSSGCSRSTVRDGRSRRPNSLAAHAGAEGYA